MRISENSLLSDQRVTEWFLREGARREQEKKKASMRTGSIPVITISRQFGAGGHTIAKKVIEKLGTEWQTWDKEVIEQIAKSAKVRTEMVEALDERTQSWIDQMVKSLLSVKMLEPIGYRRHLAQSLLALAQQGHKLILGRGANFVLPDALNVRLRASMEFRVRNIMHLENLSHEQALKQVHQVDHDRAEFTKSVFNHDVDDPSGYDMILQTDTLGYDAAATAIVAAAHAMFGKQ